MEDEWYEFYFNVGLNEKDYRNVTQKELSELSDDFFESLDEFPWSN